VYTQAIDTDGSVGVGKQDWLLMPVGCRHCGCAGIEDRQKLGGFVVFLRRSPPSWLLLTPEFIVVSICFSRDPSTRRSDGTT
jgi:hypothetical protein